MLFQNRSSVGLVILALAFASCGRTAQKENAGGGETVIPVRIQKPDRIQRPVFVAASGTVEAAQTTDLAFQLPGLVARVFVEEGQSVRKGQAIAELDAADYQFGLQASEGQAGVAQASLEKAQAGTRAEEIEQARAAYDKAENEYQRYRQLYERKSMAPVDFAKVEAGYRAAKAQYEMAQNGARKEDRAAAGASVRQAQAQVGANRKRVSDARLVSPINGIIARRSIDPGEMVSAGLPVFSIVDLNPVRVRVGIPEADIGRIRVGQRARITIPALDGGVEGSGMVDVVVVPGEAIVHDPQGSTLVYVYYPDRKRVHARRVETGSVRDREVEINSGLSGDEPVVVAGQHKLREGSLVEVMP